MRGVVGVASPSPIKVLFTRAFVFRTFLRIPYTTLKIRRIEGNEYMGIWTIKEPFGFRTLEISPK